MTGWYNKNHIFSMKILLFSTAYLPHIGGAELAVKEITDRLPGVEFDLITAKLKRGLPDYEKIGNLNVYRLGAGNKFFDKPLLPNLGFLKALKLHKKNKYDLIHGIMASQGSAAAYLFKFFYPKVPLILTLQEGDLGRNSPFDKFWQKRIIKRADAITAISGYLAEFAGRLNKKASVFVVPNGVDLEKFEKGKSINKSQEEKIIITVSRLVKKNGIDILIKAIKELKIKTAIPQRAAGFAEPSTSNYELLIIGDGKERKKLERLVEKLDIVEKVKFLGNIPNDKIPEYLVKADVFVRPSRSEGLGTAFLEAMAARVPIIGTRVGGIPDFLIDPSTSSGQATGLFCGLNDPKNLAEKITLILNDKNLRNKLVENGRKMVEQKYSWDKIAEQMKRVYDKIINHNSGL